MLIDDGLKRAVLHEAGHAVAYCLLKHQSAGIAAVLEGLKFCNLVAPDSPPVGDAAGSAAEKLILGGYDESGARQDKKGMSDADYHALVQQAFESLTPHKRKIRRIASLVISRIIWREKIEDFPPLDESEIGMKLPEGNTFSLIMPFAEIQQAVDEG
jgi:hypothetical protein